VGSGIQRVPGRYQREVAGGRREEVDQNVGEEQDDGEALAQLGEPSEGFPSLHQRDHQINQSSDTHQRTRTAGESILPKPN